MIDCAGVALTAYDACKSACVENWVSHAIVMSSILYTGYISTQTMPKSSISVISPEARDAIINSLVMLYIYRTSGKYGQIGYYLNKTIKALSDNTSSSLFASALKASLKTGLYYACYAGPVVLGSCALDYIAYRLRGMSVSGRCVMIGYGGLVTKPVLTRRISKRVRHFMAKVLGASCGVALGSLATYGITRCTGARYSNVGPAFFGAVLTTLFVEYKSIFVSTRV